MMDTDIMIKANDRLNCFLHCDRAAMKETLSPCGRSGARFCPKGWILTGWYALSSRRSKNALSGVIGVHPCSSCEKEVFSIDNTAKMAAARHLHYLCLCQSCFLPLASYLLPFTLSLSPSTSYLLPLTFHHASPFLIPLQISTN